MKIPWDQEDIKCHVDEYIRDPSTSSYQKLADKFSEILGWEIKRSTVQKHVEYRRLQVTGFRTPTEEAYYQQPSVEENDSLMDRLEEDTIESSNDYSSEYKTQILSAMEVLNNHIEMSLNSKTTLDAYLLKKPSITPKPAINTSQEPLQKASTATILPSNSNHQSITLEGVSLSPTSPYVTRSEYDALKLQYDYLYNEHILLKESLQSFRDETDQKIKSLFLTLRKQQPQQRESSSVVTPNLPINSNNIYTFEVAKVKKVLVIPVKFYDKPNLIKMNIAQIFLQSQLCKDGEFSTKDIGDLYKDVIYKLFGKEYLHYYTAASRVIKKGLTPIGLDVIDGIKSLISEGFGITEGNKNDPDELVKQSDIDRVVRSTNSYLFNNMRRTNAQNNYNTIRISPGFSGQFYDEHSRQSREPSRRHYVEVSDSEGDEDMYSKKLRYDQSLLDSLFKPEVDNFFES